MQEEALFIPKEIADKSGEALTHAFREQVTYTGFRPMLENGEMAVKYREFCDEYLQEFNTAVDALDKMMRQHIAGRN